MIQPNLNTLHCLLERDGFYPAAEIDLCVRGMLPYTFSDHALALNLIRNLYVHLAEDPAFSGKVEEKFLKVLIRLQPCLSNNPSEVYAVRCVASQINWTLYSQDDLKIL